MAGKEGYVYAMTNPAMPGLFKIGFTTLTPEKRAEQLSNTSVAAPFSVYASQHTFDARDGEARIHKFLDEYRVNPNREFFNPPPILIDAAFRSYAEYVHDRTPPGKSQSTCFTAIVLRLYEIGDFEEEDLYERPRSRVLGLRLGHYGPTQQPFWLTLSVTTEKAAWEEILFHAAHLAQFGKVSGATQRILRAEHGLRRVTPQLGAASPDPQNTQRIRAAWKKLGFAATTEGFMTMRNPASPRMIRRYCRDNCALDQRQDLLGEGRGSLAAHLHTLAHAMDQSEFLPNWATLHEVRGTPEINGDPHRYWLEVT